MKMFQYIILLGMLTLGSCKPGKEITDSKPEEYEVTVLIRDMGAVSDVMNCCIKIQVTGPVEIRQPVFQNEIVELKLKVRINDDQKINGLKEEIGTVTGVVNINVRKI